MGQILIVDDDIHILRLLKRYCTKLGYESILASDGSRALNILQDNPDIQLMITDVVMPIVNGRELVRMVKGNSEYNDLQIIVISAVESIKEITDLLELGASLFLPKPIDKKQISEAITSHLAKLPVVV